MRSNWRRFLILIEENLKYRHSSILVVSELDSKLCSNKQFWVVTHKRQFEYIELLAKSMDSKQLWTSETPFWIGDMDRYVDLNRSLTQLPSLVIFVLGGQAGQYLSIIEFFNKSGVPIVLIQTSAFDFRSLLAKISFYFFLQSEVSYFYTKNFVHYLLHTVTAKRIQVNDKKVTQFNNLFSNQASFLTLLNRWSSLIGGMQVMKKRTKKADFFIAKNKYNLRLLRKA